MEELKCKNCGGDLEWLDNHTMICPYCETKYAQERPMDEADEVQEDDEEAEEDGEEEYVAVETICQEMLDCIADADLNELYVESNGGAPLEQGSAYASKARKNFGIPRQENVYFVYDDTVFRSCKTGFAICDSGIYMCYGGEKTLVSWQELVDEGTEAVDDTDVRIGGYEASIMTDGQEEILNLLEDIRSAAVIEDEEE